MCACALFSVGGFSVLVPFEQRLKEVRRAAMWSSGREFQAEAPKVEMCSVYLNDSSQVRGAGLE